MKNQKVCLQNIWKSLVLWLHTGNYIYKLFSVQWKCTDWKNTFLSQLNKKRIVSIVTVFVNKTLLSSDTVKLDAPLFITWVQCIVSVVICLVLALIKKSYLPNPSEVFTLHIFKTVSIWSLICMGDTHKT